MNNLLIAIAVFIITVAAALFAVPHFIDWNSYRSAFEEEARNVIGRQVEIDGDVKLHLLPTPYFRVEKVRIADTSAMLSEGFFRTESLSIKLSIAPLLRGVVEAHEIELQRPVLRLALDGKGGWNWQSFAQALGSAGYMPANVALTSLKVVDGTLAFHGADGVERARLDGVNGELSAPALAGPYRFRGTYSSGGARREIRLGTGAPEADGKVPVRVSLRLLDTGASFTLDARAVDLMGRARLEGQLTAHLPTAAPPPGGFSRRPAASFSEQPDVDERATPLEVKAAVRADVTGAALSDLTLTFEQGDRPQTVSGHARAVWGSPVAIEMGLSSRWLDLDRLAGAPDGIGPVDSVAKLAGWLRGLLPGQGRTRMQLSVDRANLARAEIGPVRLTVMRSGGRLDIAELRTTLPGGSRGEIRGSISGTADALAFKGSLGLRGASTARFVAWATGGGLSLPAEADGRFDLHAHLAIDSTQTTVQDLTGTLAGTLLKGGGRYRWSGRRELAVMLEGPKLDARGLVPADLSLPDLFAALTGAASARQDTARAPAGGNAVLRALQSDLDLRLRAGQLITAARTYRDFSGAVTMKGGDLRQLTLRLTGEDGYKLQLEGRVNNLVGAPKGALRGHIAAESGASIAPLAALLGIPAAFRPGDSREQAMLPLRLAGTLTFGRRSATSADWVIDGEGGGAAIKVNARFDGSAAGWRSGRADVTASVEAGDATKLAELLFPGTTPSGTAGGARPGRILVRAGGIPSEGLTSLVTVDAAGIALKFRGQVHAADAGATAKGDLEVQAANGAVLAGLVGLAPALRVDGIPVSARLKLALDGSTIGMDQLALQLGRSRLTGKIALSPAGERRRVDASLSMDDASVEMLLGPLLDRRFGAASAAEAVLLGQRSAWPDEPFSAPVLDAFEGEVSLTCRRLRLTEDMALRNAKVKVAIQPGRIEVKELSGAALGGDFKATARIDKAAAGADVRGTLRFRIALEEIPGPRPPRASGPVSGTLHFRGRGLSPRAVVSALQGEGSIAFDDGARVPGLAPGAVVAAVEAAMKAEAGKLGATLQQTLAARLATESLPLGQSKFALEVVDGAVRGKSLVVDAREGRAIGSARLDLKALTLDTQWRLDGKAPDAGAAARPLPSVIVSYRGPVAALSGAERQIDAATLEQELSARKIERDIKELERLRRASETDPLRQPAAQPAAPTPPPPAAVPGTTPPPPAAPAFPALRVPADPAVPLPPARPEPRPAPG